MSINYKLILSSIICVMIGCKALEIDEKGYIMYCACMGRFGNQAEQLLGSLQFAKSVDRTLILPPFIEYNHININFVPFDTYIQVDHIQQYHRVITMETFMTELADIVWPKEERVILCYSPRGLKSDGCNPFEGNPFKSFWHHFGIKIFSNGSHYHSPLITDQKYANEWKIKFKHLKVWVFVGAPSAFPTNNEAVKLQTYITLSNQITEKAIEYRKSRDFSDKPYLAVHLRHGSDWVRACDLLNENPGMTQLFSSQQCSLINDHNYQLSYELCFPSFNTIIEQIRNIVNKSENKISNVYIATDNNNKTLWQLLGESLPNITLLTPTQTLIDSRIVSHHKPPSIMIDIPIMTFADQFIGNCISSFSAFVARLRTYNLNKSNHYFAKNAKTSSNSIKEEL